MIIKKIIQAKIAHTIREAKIKVKEKNFLVENLIIKTIEKLRIIHYSMRNKDN